MERGRVHAWLVMSLVLAVGTTQGCLLSDLSMESICKASGGYVQIEKLAFGNADCMDPNQTYSVWVCPEGDETAESCLKQTVRVTRECTAVEAASGSASATSSAEAVATFGLGQRVGRAELVADIFKTLASDSGPAGVRIGGTAATPDLATAAAAVTASATASARVNLDASGFRDSTDNSQQHIHLHLGSAMSGSADANSGASVVSVGSGDNGVGVGESTGTSGVGEANRVVVKSTGVNTGVGDDEPSGASTGNGNDKSTGVNTGVNTGVGDNEPSGVSTGNRNDKSTGASTDDKSTGVIPDGNGHNMDDVSGSTPEKPGMVDSETLTDGRSEDASTGTDGLGDTNKGDIATEQKGDAPDGLDASLVPRKRYSEVQEHLSELAAKPKNKKFYDDFLTKTHPFNDMVYIMMQEDSEYERKLDDIMQNMAYIESSRKEMRGGILSHKLSKGVARTTNEKYRNRVADELGEIFNHMPSTGAFMWLGTEMKEEDRVVSLLGGKSYDESRPLFECVREASRDLILESRELEEKADQEKAQAAVEYWLQKMCTIDRFLRSKRTELFGKLDEIAPPSTRSKEQQDHIDSRWVRAPRNRSKRATCSHPLRAIMPNLDQSAGLYSEKASENEDAMKEYAVTALHTLQAEQIREMEAEPKAFRHPFNSPKIPIKAKLASFVNRPLESVLEADDMSKKDHVVCRQFVKSFVSGLNFA